MVRRVPSYCPYCGGALESREFDGRERRYCESCEEFVWRDAAAHAAVVIHDGREAYLQKRAVEPGVGVWGFPAGFVDFDEHPRDGAARELREETSQVVDPAALDLVDVEVRGDEVDGYGRWFWFAVPADDVEGSVSLDEEASDWRYWTLEEFENSDEALADRARRVFEAVVGAD